jgi:hypothetical protein
MYQVIRTVMLAVLSAVTFCGAVNAAVITVPVSSSNTSAWTRSNGGTGTTMPAGGPAIWNSTFVSVIPAGATNISFTLDTFLADDKGVIKLNGTTIADAVVQRANGAAAGPGTFDFGLGAGNQAYNFVGFVPGTAFPLPNGTAQMTLVVYMNDTGVTDPAAPPLSVTNISGFSLTGSLKYTTAPAATSTTLVSSVNPALAGQSIVFTATVTGASPTGTVQFFDGASTLGTSSLTAGVATLTTPSLAAGSHVITAVYSGDANNASSTSPGVTQLINAVVIGPAQGIPTLSGMLVLLLSTLVAARAMARHGSQKRR